MDTLKTKSEIEAEKAALEETLSVLQTKDGADAFIAERKTDIQSLLKDAKSPTPGRITIQDLLAIELDKVERSPYEVVKAEVSRLEEAAGKSLSIEQSVCSGCLGCRGCRLGRTNTRGMIRVCKKLKKTESEERQ